MREAISDVICGHFDASGWMPVIQVNAERAAEKAIAKAVAQQNKVRALRTTLLPWFGLQGEHSSDPSILATHSEAAMPGSFHPDPQSASTKSSQQSVQVNESMVRGSQTVDQGDTALVEGADGGGEGDAGLRIPRPREILSDYSEQVQQQQKRSEELQERAAKLEWQLEKQTLLLEKALSQKEETDNALKLSCEQIKSLRRELATAELQAGKSQAAVVHMESRLAELTLIHSQQVDKLKESSAALILKMILPGKLRLTVQAGGGENDAQGAEATKEAVMRLLTRLYAGDVAEDEAAEQLFSLNSDLQVVETLQDGETSAADYPGANTDSLRSVEDRSPAAAAAAGVVAATSVEESADPVEQTQHLEAVTLPKGPSLQTLGASLQAASLAGHGRPTLSRSSSISSTSSISSSFAAAMIGGGVAGSDFIMSDPKKLMRLIQRVASIRGQVLSSSDGGAAGASSLAAGAGRLGPTGQQPASRSTSTASLADTRAGNCHQAALTNESSYSSLASESFSVSTHYSPVANSSIAPSGQNSSSVQQQQLSPNRSYLRASTATHQVPAMSNASQAVNSSAKLPKQPSEGGAGGSGWARRLRSLGSALSTGGGGVMNNSPALTSSLTGGTEPLNEYASFQASTVSDRDMPTKLIASTPAPIPAPAPTPGPSAKSSGAESDRRHDAATKAARNISPVDQTSWKGGKGDVCGREASPRTQTQKLQLQSQRPGFRSVTLERVSVERKRSAGRESSTERHASSNEGSRSSSRGTSAALMLQRMPRDVQPEADVLEPKAGRGMRWAFTDAAPDSIVEELGTYFGGK